MTDTQMPRALSKHRSARLLSTPRGLEVRCPDHGHLLGVFIHTDQLEIKCGRDEYVVVRFPVSKEERTAT